MSTNEAGLWTSTVFQTISDNYAALMTIYEGKEGALRLAREYGFGLAFYDNGKQEVVNSYSALAVRVYNLNPPLDSGEWNKEVEKARQKGIELIRGKADET